MASQKTRQVQIPSANGSKPPQRPEVPPPPDNPKRAAAGKRPKTKAAKTPKVAAAETPLAALANTAAEPQTKKLSALDAAAQLLAETGQAMTCAAMIEAMAAKGSWTSPGGKTPAATLYSAILRELNTKGANARFQKTGRGTFAHA